MKIALGLACFAVAVTIVVADSPTYTSGDYFDAPWDKKTIKNKAGEFVRPMQCTNGGNSQYIKEECGLPGLPGYVLGCCVYMGPLADIDNYGKCDLASSGGYRTWCDECYDFPGETFMGQPLGVTYTGVPGDPSKIVMGESATPGEATCEFGTCPSPGVPAGSCWTSANPKTDCLRNIPYDFDFKVDGKSDGVVDYCCDLVPESYVHVEDPTINDCFTYDVNPDTGCIVESSVKFNDGATCYPDPTNKCDRGTCQTLANGDRKCDSAPVVCNDSNDCTTDGVCDRSDGCPDPQPKDDNVPCQSTEPCFGNGVCKSGACADAAPTECPSGATCDPEQNACVETQNADLAPLFAAAAGGLCCFGAAAAILVKKRNDAMEEAKRDSIMTQKTDNYGRADMGMKNKHMSTMTGVSRMTRGGGSGGDKYEATSHFTRNSDGVSQKSRASRTSRSSAGRNSVGRGSTGRSSGSRKGDYDFKSSGTRSTVGGSSHGGRSSRSSKSRNSNGTRRTSGSRNSQSRGSRSSRGRY